MPKKTDNKPAQIWLYDPRVDLPDHQALIWTDDDGKGKGGTGYHREDLVNLKTESVRIDDIDTVLNEPGTCGELIVRGIDALINKTRKGADNDRGTSSTDNKTK